MLSRQHVIQSKTHFPEPTSKSPISSPNQILTSNFFLTLFQRVPSVFYLSVSRFNKTLNELNSVWLISVLLVVFDEHQQAQTQLSVPFQAARVAGCPGETGPQGTEAGGPADHSKERADSLKRALHDWLHHSKTTMPLPQPGSQKRQSKEKNQKSHRKQR